MHGTDILLSYHSFKWINFPLTITIPNIEEFNFCVGNYGPGPVYNMHTLTSHYFLITYLESQQLAMLNIINGLEVYLIYMAKLLIKLT